MADIPVEQLEQTMANSIAVCREETTPSDPFADELAIDQFTTDELGTVVEMRPRGLSVRSGVPMPSVPENTPATSNSVAPSIVSTSASVGERLIRPAATRLETLQRERPGIFWELDTTAPDNTPMSTTILRPQNERLPQIDEVIQRLPPPRTGPHSNDNASDFDVQSIRSGDFNSVRSEFGTPSPNTTRRAPPPTPVTQFARSTMTSPGVGSLAEPERAEAERSFRLSAAASETTVVPKDGILEWQDWEWDCEDIMAAALARLAQLAVDKTKKDSSKTAEEFYRKKLNRMINDPIRRFRPGPIDLSTVPLPSLPFTLPIVTTPTRAEVRIIDERMSQLEEKVDKLMQFMNDTTKARKDSNEDTLHIRKESKGDNLQLRKEITPEYERVD